MDRPLLILLSKFRTCASAAVLETGSCWMMQCSQTNPRCPSSCESGGYSTATRWTMTCFVAPKQSAKRSGRTKARALLHLHLHLRPTRKESGRGTGRTPTMPHVSLHPPQSAYPYCTAAVARIKYLYRADLSDTRPGTRGCPYWTEGRFLEAFAFAYAHSTDSGDDRFAAPSSRGASPVPATQ